MLFLVQIIFISIFARADLMIIKDSAIYVVPTKSDLFARKVGAEDLKTAQFLQIQSAGTESASASFKPLSVGSAPKSNWLDKTKKPILQVPEGCGKHPMEWLSKATQVAQLDKALDGNTYYLEIPRGYKADKQDPTFEKTLKVFLEAPDSEEDDDGSFKNRVAACMKTAKFFAKDGKKIAYVDCDDELNEVEYIFAKEATGPWSTKEVESFTLTDNCP